MKASRILVGSLSSAVWPALVVVVPLGITFSAARVYAEASVRASSCDAGEFAACADAAVGAVCANPRSAATSVCQRARCIDDPGATAPLVEALACTAVVTCDQSVDECSDKHEGAACQDGQGTCTRVPNGCYEITGDAGVPKDVVNCRITPGREDGGARTSTPGDDGGVAIEPAASDDSGCASAPGSVPGVAGLLGAPLVLGMLLARRRRRDAGRR